MWMKSLMAGTGLALLVTGNLVQASYVEGNPISNVDPSGLDAMTITGGYRGGTNIFGHGGMAVTGNGVYSYGNDTPLGSSPTNYILKQSLLRNQMITIIPTTPAQDALMINYFNQHPGMNDVNRIDNCAVRTNEALMSGGVPVQGIPFPGGLARDVRGIPGATTYFIPQGGPIPQGLLNVLPNFNRR